MKRTLCFLLSLATTGLLARESVNFVSQPLTAGRASLAGDGYILSRTLGEAAFSPELRFPVQLIYDSSSDKGGLFGYGWRSPQLESSVVPDRNTVVWVTPWGEKIQFTAKSAIDKKSLFSFFAPKIKGRGYFTPYGDWEADTPAGGDAAASSGDWAFTGKLKYEAGSSLTGKHGWYLSPPRRDGLWTFHIPTADNLSLSRRTGARRWR